MQSVTALILVKSVAFVFKAHYEVLEKLLQYFEKQDNLEGETAGPTVVNIPGLEFVSYITFEGVPILPPVVSQQYFV